ncbi:hypothetical protein DPX16_4963 [Anabarilius grahami]|uniref:Uncharacterized protein n=1 Tax=Anabarilius grahami TaxID=495550 RepID=A0A3N0XTZ0_ANAGA|nr:hypothetical protein DPX16_4963 [Anabarilius grahami]
MQIEIQKELCSPSRRCDRRYDSPDQTRESRGSSLTQLSTEGPRIHTQKPGVVMAEKGHKPSVRRNGTLAYLEPHSTRALDGGIAEHETSSRGNVKHSHRTHTDRCLNNSRRQSFHQQYGYSGHVTINLLSENKQPL